MKKVTLSLIVALCFSMLSYSANPGPTIGIKIVFGKKSMDCKRFGICEFSIIFDMDELFEELIASVEERTGYGYGNITKSSELQLSLIKQYMTVETLKTFFKDGEFIVEEDITLSSDVTQALGIKPGYTIKKGVYSYSENTKEIILNL